MWNMKKYILIFMLSAFAVISFAFGTDRVKKIKYPGGKTYMYRVALTDKNGTPYTLDHPEEFFVVKVYSPTDTPAFVCRFY